MNTITIRAAAAIPATVFRVARRLFRRAAKPARLWLLAREERLAEESIADLSAMHVATLQNILRMHRVTVQLAAKRQAIERGVA